jgi:hypothetical protein
MEKWQRQIGRVTTPHSTLEVVGTWTHRPPRLVLELELVLNLGLIFVEV